MHGICFDYDLQDWFDFKIPRTKIDSNFIEESLQIESSFETKPNAKIVWTGGKPLVEEVTKTKKGESWELLKLTFHQKTNSFAISLDKEKGNWFLILLEEIHLENEKRTTFQQIKNNFESQFNDFELFWYSKPINTIRDYGLLVL